MIGPAAAGRERGNGRRRRRQEEHRDEWEQPLSQSQAGRHCRKGGGRGGHMIINSAS